MVLSSRHSFIKKWTTSEMAETSRRRTGVVLCGFGRAGKIHFNGIRSNHLCTLKYVVDLVEKESIRESIQAQLDEYFMEGVRLVGVNEFSDVCEQNR